MKLNNYRCNDCQLELELLDDPSDDEESDMRECPRCGGEMKKFNFKNNRQRFRFRDRETK